MFQDIELAIQNYCDQECRGDDVNPLQYWQMASKSPDIIQKKIADFASYYLTPPPTSVDVERLFSTAGDLLNNERNRYIPENAEKMLFCHENLPVIKFQY